MSKYTKKDRDYASWFDDPAFSAYVSSIHGGVGSIQDSENGVLPGGKDYANQYYQYWMQNQQNQWQQDMYREDRAWQEDMYERYQSIGGQIDQMRQNGINPMMMFAGGGVNAPGVNSGQIPSSGSGASAPGSSVHRTNSFQQLMGIFQMLTGLAGTGVNLGQGISAMVRNRYQNDVSKAQADNYAADTQLKYQQADGQMLDNIGKSIDLQFKRYNNVLEQEKNQQSLNQMFQDFEKGKNEIRLQENQIYIATETADKQIAIVGLEHDIKQQEKLIAQLNENMKRMDRDTYGEQLTYQIEYQKHLAALTEAQSEKVKAEELSALWDSSLKYLQYCKESQLLEAGYVDELILSMRRDRKAKTATAVVGNICNVLNTLISIIPGAGVDANLAVYPSNSTSSFSY